MKIALLSPSQNAYSETFIQAHKELLKGEVYYYYGGDLPVDLEGGLVINSRRRRIIDIIKGYFRLNRFSLNEQALITSFKKNKINIVFAEYGPTAHKILPVCRELDLPLIVHFHGYDASQTQILKDYNYFQEVFNYAHFVVVVSKRMYKDFLEYGCSKEKLIYNVYGPREDFLEIKPQFLLNQFVGVGRFVNKKAPYYLILAFVHVVKLFPEAKLVIAGDGELRDACFNLIKYYKLEDNIDLPGIISKEQYKDYLRTSLAFVQHSITAENGDAEGTPVSILEASAAGLPVISTIHAGIPDVVENGKTGLLVKEHDVQGMADCMIQLLQEQELARELGNNGKENIKDKFSLEKHIYVLNELLFKASQNSGSTKQEI